MLALSLLLAQQEKLDNIVHFIADAVESLGPLTTKGMFFDGRWQETRLADAPSALAGPPEGFSMEAGPTGEGPVAVADSPWSWSYSLSTPYGPVGYLVVGAAAPPPDSQQFLLRVLAQQAGVALTSARLRAREREHAADLSAANLALRHSVDIHDRLTRAALGDEGQQGIAQAVHELTDRPVAIEDRFGNLQAWAGPGRPDPYPKDEPTARDKLLARAMAATAPLREGTRILSVARLEGRPAGMLVVHDYAETAGEAERMAIEHATTVLTMEISRLQALAQQDARLRTGLVLDLVSGTDPDPAALLSRAQGLGYDLGRPHRVVMVEAHTADQDTEAFSRAVGRAASALRVGGLTAMHLHGVIVLADRETPWEQFRARVVVELHGGRCRVGVGGVCAELVEFSRSSQEADLALRMQKEAGGPDRVTLFDELGVYKVLAMSGDTAAMERFVADWLDRLLEYDSLHGTVLVLTLSEYLDCGGNYDATAKAMSVHRSTVKYRLKRIRQISGQDIGLPDIQFNLQVATHAWRTLRAMRTS
jgi:DNA-binding PucR family transcriptional regulator